MGALTLNTLKKTFIEVFVNSLEHFNGQFGDVGSDVVLEGFQGHGTIIVNLGFEVAPQEKIAWGQKMIASRDNAASMFSLAIRLAS